jgi:BirA family transcriptional regulator, biotin operon repressor / biotin---[acetyl-CoA-carboxylase] ligase
MKLITLDSVDSTNNYLWEKALAGEPQILAVRAREQTHGKGRQGKVWQSAKDKGIYVSFLLRPNRPIDEINFLPLVFGLAVVKSIEALVEPKIKYPNDVLVKDKKICGVLVEASRQGQKIDFLIAGIGLNINSTSAEIPQHATSLMIEMGKKCDLERIFKYLYSNVIELYNEFELGKMKELLAQVYKKKTSGSGDKDISQGLSIREV